MAQGDRWKLSDGREGIEIARDGDKIYFCEIKENWPFPGLPVWVLRKDCKKMPLRYLKGAYPTDEDALM